VREALADGRVDDTEFTQPGLFAFEVALYRLLESWGVRPRVLVGHSIGELTAAYLAGVWSLQDACALVAARGRLMGALPAGGAMVALRGGEAAVRAVLTDGVSIAAVNGPDAVVISGAESEVMAIAENWAGKTTRLRVSHAFHSVLMEPMLEEFEEQIRKLKLNPPRIPFVSNVTGKWITVEEAQDPCYWVRHMHATIRFADGIRRLLQDSQRIFLEIGSGHALTRLARQQRGLAQQREFFSSLSEPEADISAILGVLGHLWLSGAKIDWTMFNSRSAARRLPLPTYPFVRQRYWIEASPHSSVTKYSDPPPASPSKNPDFLDRTEFERQGVQEPRRLHERPPLKTAYVPPTNDLEAAIAAIFQRALSVSRIGIEDNFFDFGGDSLMALQVIAEMKKTLHMDVPVVNLYEHLTIRSLAASVNHREAQNEGRQNCACQLPTERMTTRYESPTTEAVEKLEGSCTESKWWATKSLH